MSEHRAMISWKRTSDNFDYETYSRNHYWHFTEGIQIAASAAPDFKGSPGAVDPEEALVAALSSCHMLTFLAITAKKKLPVARYDDSAVGYLEKNLDGKLALTRVTLRPTVVFDEGTEVSPESLERLHESAHRNCFIANSVKTQVTIEAPQDEHSPG